MFTNCVLLLLLGFVLHVVSATDCSCTDYDDTAARTYTDCMKLEAYIKCLESENKKATCTPTAANLPGMKVKTGCSAIKPPCTCQIVFWATDRTKAGENCKALQTYKSCLDPETTETGCGGEQITDLRQNVANGLAACGSTTTASNSKDGARTVEANGLTTIILLSILGMFFI